MAEKENKGGTLTNSQIEEDNKVKGKQTGAYEGTQEEGDKKLKQRIKEMQQRNGVAEDGTNEEE